MLFDLCKVAHQWVLSSKVLLEELAAVLEHDGGLFKAIHLLEGLAVDQI